MNVNHIHETHFYVHEIIIIVLVAGLDVCVCAYVYVRKRFLSLHLKKIVFSSAVAANAFELCSLATVSITIVYICDDDDDDDIESIHTNINCSFYVYVSPFNRLMFI